MISTKFQSLAKVQSIFRRQAQLSSHLQKYQSSNFVCQPQLSKTGRLVFLFLFIHNLMNEWALWSYAFVCLKLKTNAVSRLWRNACRCCVTLTVLTYSTFSYVTSTPVIPNHSLLSMTDLVNVATFTHCIACLFTAVTYNKI